MQKIYVHPTGVGTKDGLTLANATNPQLLDSVINNTTSPTVDVCWIVGAEYSVPKTLVFTYEKSLVTHYPINADGSTTTNRVEVVGTRTEPTLSICEQINLSNEVRFAKLDHGSPFVEVPSLHVLTSDGSVRSGLAAFNRGRHFCTGSLNNTTFSQFIFRNFNFVFLPSSMDFFSLFSVSVKNVQALLHYVASKIAIGFQCEDIISYGHSKALIRIDYADNPLFTRVVGYGGGLLGEPIQCLIQLTTNESGSVTRPVITDCEAANMWHMVEHIGQYFQGDGLIFNRFVSDAVVDNFRASRIGDGGIDSKCFSTGFTALKVTDTVLLDTYRGVRIHDNGVGNTHDLSNVTVLNPYNSSVQMDGGTLVWFNDQYHPLQISSPSLISWNDAPQYHAIHGYIVNSIGDLELVVI